MSWHSTDGADGTDRSTGVRWADDDHLGEDLAAALADGPLYERVVGSAQTAFRAHRGMLAAREDLDLDLLLLSLVYDSSESPQASGVRDRTGGSSRVLAFQGNDLGVEVEVEATSIEGQLIPPRPGRISLQSPDAVVTTLETDAVGYFRIDVRPQGPLRLVCDSIDGTCVTQWLPW
ncbi:hypothetical protein [Cellulomonas soli]|uniref:Uncharacterized protein n=1 Tax=Cellulomonas soli TaxID=931535 RepID=A0A512P970_9CELL|nr:hypothetical protein [Cellulomonas soli]NYI57965.1 hypothetical protein [Cellulomonas soli]GEP67748.1 hypothetical protein CSO01_04630 [Cellulomonas soli]